VVSEGIIVTKAGEVRFSPVGVYLDGWRFDAGGKARSYADMMRAVAGWLRENGRQEDAERVLAFLEEKWP
jgi:hypothetical protein